MASTDNSPAPHPPIGQSPDTLFLSAAYLPHAPHPVLLGFNFGPLLGQGSYGKVRLATSDDLTLAVKIYKRYHLQSSKMVFYEDGLPVYGNALEGLHREISIYKSLNHPRVCKLHALVELEDQTQILLFVEHCALGNLMDIGQDRFVYNSKLEKYLAQYRGLVDLFQRARYLAIQLLEGLDYLHKHGVAHRDLKPCNIGFNAEGQLKIFDFGTACRVSAQQPLVMEAVGTPGFRGPEVQFGDEGYNPLKLDIFSVGVTMCVYITGQMPFRGQSAVQIDSQANNTPIVLGANVPADLKQLIERSTSKRPQQRSSAEQLLHILK